MFQVVSIFQALEGVCVTLQNELNLEQDEVVDSILSLLHVSFVGIISLHNYKSS